MNQATKPIPGAQHYSITQDGRVYSHTRTTGKARKIKGRWLKERRIGIGQIRYVDISVNGRPRPINVTTTAQKAWKDA